MRNILSRRTPYDDEHGTCAETRAELLIYPGDSVEVADISARLRIDPTEAVIAGEEKASGSGRRRIAKKSLWRLSSDQQVRSLDLRRHLDWLLSRVAPASEGLAQL